MSSPEVPTVPLLRTLIVEERLRLTLASLHCVKRPAFLADEPHGVRLFADLKGFARVVRSFAKTLEDHVRAIKAALPPHCSNLDAPDAEGGAR